MKWINLKITNLKIATIHLLHVKLNNILNKNYFTKQNKKMRSLFYIFENFFTIYLNSLILLYASDSISWDYHATYSLWKTTLHAQERKSDNGK